MAVPFVTRDPTQDEVERLRLVLSTFRDGSGMLAVGNETLPGWRDFERAVAAVLGGRAPETKGIFDVTVPSTERPSQDYGLSIKSKALSMKGGLTNLNASGRVYMELANSQTKFLDALRLAEFEAADFTALRYPQVVGETALRTVAGWHLESVALHLRAYGRELDLRRSRYLVLSYSSAIRENDSPAYQWHSFSLDFPPGIIWAYASPRCLRGYDPAYPNEALFDFYLLSGGQLKYYPRASNAKFSSPIFHLRNPRRTPILLRAAKTFPAEWLAAGGAPSIDTEHVLDELRSLVQLTTDTRVRSLLTRAVAKIERLTP